MKTPSTPSDAPQPADQPWVIIWHTWRARNSRLAISTLRKWLRKVVKSVKPAHLNLNLMPASDKDAGHTIGCAATRRPTMDHNMVYVVGEKLKLHLLSTCLFVRFYEILNVSARSDIVRGSVERARAHLNRGINKGFDRGWHYPPVVARAPSLLCAASPSPFRPPPKTARWSA
jgi:hypothetical protein